MNTPPQNPEKRPQGSNFEHLDPEEQLAECIEVLGSRGTTALEELLGKHPELAPSLRSRLATLGRLGMLTDNEAEELPTVGPYRLRRTLGHGAMSRVFLAQHESTGQAVALKILTAPVLGDSRARQRFEREVHAVSSLAHPSIVEVYGSGLTDDRPWFAMEYVPGATLEEIIAELGASDIQFDELDGAHIRGIAQRDSDPTEVHGKGRGYVESICRIMLDIAAALEHAHTFGIVHRDVKPGNIAVTREGRAKLLDLGLASLEGSPSLTRTGDFAGTPYYVAPEQANAVRDADPRSDIFSLGVTLYEALTLQRPFEGKDAIQVFRNLQTQDPVPPGRVNPLLPRDLETICLRALEKNPDERYGSMAELATDLERFLEFRPVHAKPISLSRRGLRLARRHPNLTLMAGLLLMLLIGTPVVLARINRAIVRERDVAQANAIEADRQAGISQAVVDHLVDLFSPPPEFDGQKSEWGFDEMLDASIVRIPGEMQQDPLLRAALLEAAGRIHSNLERISEAVPLLNKAYALRQRELADGEASLATTLVWLSNAHLDAGNPAAAYALASRGAEAMQAAGSAARNDVLFDLRFIRTRAAKQKGESPKALAELIELEGLCRQFPDELGPRSAAVQIALAELQLSTNELESAARHCSAALEQLQQAWVPDARRMTEALRLQASIHLARGAPDAAARSESEAMELIQAFDRGSQGLSVERWHSTYPIELLPAWTDAYEAAFQRGIIGLQARRPQEAIAAFEDCLGNAPNHPVSLYNLACAFAMAGDKDGALDALSRAKVNRFGILQGNLEAIGTDPDLALLHDDPRFERLAIELKTGRDQALERAETPRLFVPTGFKVGATESTSQLQLLVVLAGDAVPSGEDRFESWRALASANGFALAYIEGLLAGQHSAWIAELDNFLESPWEVEERPAAAVEEFAAELSIGAGQALLIGEGSGAPVAFDLALRAPGFFAGALLLDGLVAPTPDGGALALTRACDSRFRLIMGSDADLLGAGTGQAPSQLAEDLEAWMRQGGLEATAEGVPGRATELPLDQLSEELRRLFSAP